MRKLMFTRRKFGDLNKDIETALKKSDGAIFLNRVSGEPYDPEEDGEKLFKVLTVLFPRQTLDVLAKRLYEQSLSSGGSPKAPPPRFGAILNI